VEHWWCMPNNGDDDDVAGGLCILAVYGLGGYLQGCLWKGC